MKESPRPDFQVRDRSRLSWEQVPYLMLTQQTVWRPPKKINSERSPERWGNLSIVP
jgi:hypothetical protein